MSTVNASVKARVPRNGYTCRFIKGEASNSKNSGNRMIRAGFEILTPDIVPNDINPSERVQVGGRKGDCYIIIDENAKNYKQTEEALARLKLLDENGKVDEDRIVRALNNTNAPVYFFAVVDSEEDIQRLLPPPGSPKGTLGAPIIGPDGKPMTNGWRMKLLDIGGIHGVVPAPNGLPARAPF